MTKPVEDIDIPVPWGRISGKCCLKKKRNLIIFSDE